MKSLFTPFGIWLPRNSGAQAELPSTLDLSNHDVNERLSMLKTKGHPLLTLINIRGHVMLYMGQKREDEETAMTYQNIWGMSDAKNTKRYVIGQSVFLPLLTSFPEHSDILSEAARPAFKLIYLDALDTTPESQHNFIHQFLHANQAH